MKKVFFFGFCSFICLLAHFCYAQVLKPDPQIGVIEKLGGSIPLDLSFTDEKGNSVLLKNVITKPTILSLVYFKCPSICSPLLNGVVDVLDKTDMKPGVDYQVLTVSFNEKDTHELALEKKNNYLKAFSKPFPEDGWRFLTGETENILKLTEAVGFQFKRQGQDFLHPGVIMALSKEGKISRYFYGISYLPFDIKMGLIEASEGRTGPTINKVLMYCFSYDADGKRYVFNILKVTGSLTLLFLFFFVIFLVMGNKKSSSQETPKR